MSKNITIQEGGVAKQLTVDKLKTNLVGGSTCTWVPEDEVQLGTKYISENGTYKASADGLYGYSEVTVSGIGTVTGKDPDGSGDEATATVDPETGEIVISKIPSSIEVIAPPTNPYGIYMNGQAITKDGMIVKAYLESGGEYGTVPNGEITLNPTTAVYDESKDAGITGEATVSDTTGLSQDTIDALPIGYGTQIIGTSPYYETGMPGGISNAITSLTHTAPVYAFAQTINGQAIPFLCSTEPFSGIFTTHNPGGDAAYNSNISSSSAVINRKIVHYAQAHGAGSWSYRTPPVSTARSATEVAYVILYGTRDEKPAGSTQTITVSWPCPGSGAILETTFDILVAPPIYGGGNA